MMGYLLMVLKVIGVRTFLDRYFRPFLEAILNYVELYIGALSNQRDAPL